MLTTQSVKNLVSVKAEGVLTVTATTPRTGVTYERPVFDTDTILNLDEECMVSLCNRMLAIDYRNVANKPLTKAELDAQAAVTAAVNREDIAGIKADDTLTDAEKFAKAEKYFG